jgi:hypothetical protein
MTSFKLMTAAGLAFALLAGTAYAEPVTLT